MKQDRNLGCSALVFLLLFGACVFAIILLSEAGLI